MMRTLIRFHSPILAACACMLAVACSSVPLHYYTLQAADNRAAATPVDTAPFLIDVMPVDIPAQVDMMQLVVRQDETALGVLDSERWASPLNEELRNALSTALTQKLGTQDMHGLPAVASPGTRPLLRIEVQVRRFESRPGQFALLEADWSLGFMRPPDARRLLCHSRLHQAVESGYSGLVRGHQQAVAALSAQIAVAAQGWAVSQQAQCPEADIAPVAPSTQ